MEAIQEKENKVLELSKMGWYKHAEIAFDDPEPYDDDELGVGETPTKNTKRGGIHGT